MPSIFIYNYVGAEIFIVDRRMIPAFVSLIGFRLLESWISLAGEETSKTRSQSCTITDEAVLGQVWVNNL